ncbi:MAG: GAF domain-containing protein [Chloroflexi bacterium]|nr:GAF domain-containing protein [Chloroflexota bacterium]
MIRKNDSHTGTIFSGLTINRLRLAAILVSFVIVAASVGVTLWGLDAQQNDALLINLAGRQRMFIQQMTLEALDIQIADNPLSRRALEETAALFEQTLTALSEGGEVFYTEGITVTLPPPDAHDAEISAQLEIVRVTWDEMHLSVRGVLENDTESAAFAAALAKVEELSPVLLAQMDEAVRLYEADARRKVALVRAVQFVFLGMAVLMLVFAFILIERRILNPISLLDDAARRIGKGDLRTPISISGLGELDRLANSLEEMRLKLKAAAETQTALLELSSHLQTSENERRVAEYAVGAAASILHADFSALVLPDPRGRLIVEAVRGWPENYAGNMELGRGGDSQTGYTILHGRPIFVEDYSMEMAFTVPQIVFDHGIVSGLSAPMLIEGNVVGAMLVHSRKRRRFSEDEIQVLCSIANQTAVALEKNRLIHAEARRAQEAETLREAGAVVAATLRQDEAIERILQQLARVVPYDSASVLLLGDGYLEIVGGHGWANPAEVVGLRFPVPGNNPNTSVIQEGRPHILGDAPAAFTAFRDSPHSHVRSWLGVPLIVGERVIGMLAVDNVIPDFFTPNHARLAAAFADQVGIAIENARLYAETEKHAGQLRALREAGHTLTSDLRLDAVLRTLVEIARNLVGVSYAALAVMDDNGSLAEFYTAGLSDLERVRIGDPPKGLGLLGALLREGIPIRLTDMGRDPRSIGFPPGHPPMKVFMGVPIIVRGKVMGSLYLTDKKDGQVFTRDDEDLVVGLAADAAIAIENARMFGRVEQLAITDSLTGLHNRRHFLELAEYEFQRARRYRRPLALIMLDIDHFKQANDTYGHAIGDLVLQTVSRRCQETLRSIDFMGRFGGDEFAVLLPENDLEGAYAAAERLRKSVEEISIAADHGAVVSTISLGVAAISDDCPDLKTLLGRVDAALYAAKEAGRNQVRKAADLSA